MKKFFEYVCVCSAVLGTLVMIGAVGSIETDKWIQGGAMALLCVAMFILSLYAQEESK